MIKWPLHIRHEQTRLDCFSVDCSFSDPKQGVCLSREIDSVIHKNAQKWKPPDQESRWAVEIEPKHSGISLHRHNGWLMRLSYWVITWSHPKQSTAARAVHTTATLDNSQLTRSVSLDQWMNHLTVIVYRLLYIACFVPVCQNVLCLNANNMRLSHCKSTRQNSAVREFGLL